jgi:mannose-6-phosphate isomerase-like protein (cupin superfamily)
MSTLKPIVINQTEQSWEGWDDAEIAAKSAIRWKILISGERGPSAGLVNGIAEFPVGTRLPLHHHEPAETYYVVSGQGRMEIDGHDADIGPGSTVYIPSNAKHAVRCTGAEPLVFVFTFACDRFDKIVYHFDE